MNHDRFERLLAKHGTPAFTYIRFKLPSKADADDVWQETCIAAYQGFANLRSEASFRPWLIGIAKNKCRDWFRSREAMPEFPAERLSGASIFAQRRADCADAVREALAALGEDDRQLLSLYYLHELPQSEIAAMLGIPVGTVKSRLYTARGRFRENYPYEMRGENDMKALPKTLPNYEIRQKHAPAFFVKWEEMMGWFLIPREGEHIAWAIYDREIGSPSDGLRGEYTEMEVVGKAEVHGIGGVEIRSREYSPMACNATGEDPAERHFAVQLTDTHCRILAESHRENGVLRCFTFLDGDAFLDNWGFGEDNIGNETDLAPKGDIIRDGSRITTVDKRFLLDVVGRYEVTIGGRTFDTVCVMDVETYNSGVVSEQFIDQSGRTILWRRFNRDDWAIERYEKRWSERLPKNERITVNGGTYVHWYDCITDYPFR